MFLLTPLLTYPAWKYGWKFLWVIPVLALSSSIYLIIMSLVYDVTPIRLLIFEVLDFHRRWFYNPTHARAGPWLMGEVFLYLIEFFKLLN
jgi:hypothetical protein